MPAATTSITVTPTAADALATITVNGNPVISGNPSAAISLSLGANTITTVVTAEDAVTTKTYTIKVNRGITIVSQVKGFSNSAKTQFATAHLGATLLSYDATGVEKLVVAIGLEAGFNGQTSNVTGITFNGVALTQALEENTKGGPGDGGSAEIWYLDAPLQGSAISRQQGIPGLSEPLAETLGSVVTPGIALHHPSDRRSAGGNTASA